MPNSRPTPRLTRRDLLGLAGMAAAGGGLACLGTVLGYLALDRLVSPQRPTVTPSPLPTRPGTLKQIDRPGILTRQDWGALPPNHEAPNESGFFSADNPDGWRVYDEDLRQVYRTVVIHHSVLYAEDDLSTMRAIQEQHMDLRGWADIAYHFGVGRSGQVFEGRSLTVRGTHVQGYNTGSVGVVFLGDFTIDYPTPLQFEAGRRLIDWLALRLELTHLAGHSDFNNDTDCPGQHLRDMLPLLAQSAGLTLGTGGYVAAQG
ncbi:MAG: hypothetical protein Kow00106_20740 [Anaerolineae bacterium]